jgi:hypothetical protein
VVVKEDEEEDDDDICWILSKINTFMVDSGTVGAKI